ncbi:hypothetical protein CL644_01080 [bacterium]|nr:hypothetical protein [bacterium]|tara:strand:- start:1355 stop:1762 length:408 start_codon:yes stop_codon:yes gene_type:complete
MLPHHSKLTKYFFAAFVVVLLFYAYFEARNLLYGPQIVLQSGEAITVQEELIEISGTVKNVVEITLSGRPVFIDDTGFFTEKLLLADGLNRFVFEARDKFNRKTQEVLEVVYQIPTSDMTEHELLETDTIEEPLK